MNLSLPRLPYSRDKLFGFLFLIVLIIPLAFSEFNYESFEIIKYALLFIFTGLALAFGLAANKQQEDKAVRGPKALFYCLALFWLWALLSSLLAWDKNYSFFGFYARFTNGFLFYTLWSILLALFCLLGLDKIKALLKTLIFTSGLVALWGLLQSVGFGFYLGFTTDFFNRAAPSFLGNPDFSSMFVAALLPLTLAFLYQSCSLKSRVYYGVSVALQLWSLAIFASRGALLGLAAGLLVAVVLTLIFSKGSRKFLILIVLTLLLSLWFGSEFLNFARPNAVATTASFNNDPNISNRLGVWKLSLGSVKKRPVFGVGLGNFELMFEHDRKSPIVASGFFDDAHNLPLELAVTGGLPFLLLFLGLIALAVISALKQLAAEYNPLNIALVASIAAWLVGSLFNPVAIPCYMAVALLVSACFSNRANLPSWVSGNGVFKKIILVLGLVFAVYGAVFITAETLFYSGTQAYDAHNYLTAYKEITVAERLNPTNRLYYVYRAGSAIRAGLPPAQIQALLAAADKLNPGRADSYIQDASLYYLLLYQTQSLSYGGPIISNMRKAISLDPFSVDNYSLMAQYQLVLRQLPAAEASIQTSLSLNPQSYDSWILLAKIYQLDDNKTQVIAALNQALKIEPTNLELIKVIGLAAREPDIRTLPLGLNFNLGYLS